MKKDIIKPIGDFAKPLGEFINPPGDFKHDLIEGVSDMDKEYVFAELVCDKHGPYLAKGAYLSWCGNKATEPTFDPCPQCYAEREDPLAKKEREHKETDEEARFRRMGIGRKFRGATLETYEAATESQKAAVGAIRELKRRGRGFLVLSGSFGVGKTHLACAAARLMGGAVCTMAEISMRIRSAYSARAEKTEEEVMDELCSLPFLAIDEMGRSKMQEAAANWLSHIVNARYSRELPTMILTNKKLARELPEERWEESFEAMVGDDVAQRLMSDGVVIALEGENRRRRR